MPVVALLGNKGGAGKTTLSINLASILADHQSTALVDADMQQSSSQWFDLIEFQTDLSVHSGIKELDRSVEKLRKDNQYIVIDCPPSIHSSQTKKALETADLVLVPVLPSPLDIWASVKIESEIDKARNNNPDLKAMLVINQLEPRTKLSQAIISALSELSIDAAETPIRRRMAYRMSILEGKSVSQLGARGREAKNELNNLLLETGLLS